MDGYFECEDGRIEKTIQTESDEEKRSAASEELQKLLADDMPYAFLVQHPKVLAYRDSLKGVNYYEVQKSISKMSVSTNQRARGKSI